MKDSLWSQDRRALAYFIETARDYLPLPTFLSEQPLTVAWRWAAGRFAERVAVVGRDHTWSYRELDRHSRRIARAVQARLGRGHEPVAMLCYHDAPGLAALWGILLAGKFYVPLDLAFPSARLRAVLDDLETRLVVVERAGLPLIAELDLLPEQILVVDDLLEAEDAAVDGAGDDLDPDIDDSSVSIHDAAYIIFTSGTTGAPKGVVETHRNVVRFSQHSVDVWKLTRYDVHLMMTSLSFSATATVIFPPLLSGGAIRCVNPQREGMAALHHALAEGGLTVASIPPAVLRVLPDLLGVVPHVPTLRQVRLGGDVIRAVDLEIVNTLMPSNGVARLGYGLSELKYAAGFHADHATQLPDAGVPAGFCVDYVSVEIHDDDGNRLGTGEHGEIVLFSDYLSPGYWRRPELTAAKFGIDAAGRRFYRSGDLGYVDDESCLWMLGRRDGQLKIRGQRVETAEIEVALEALPGVREALVMAHTRHDGEKELVAYVAPSDVGSRDAHALRRQLAERLPDYMVPVAIGFLDEFPRNSNHKPDRSRLPAIESLQTSHAPATSPANALEQTLAELVGEMLGRPAVGRDENFFELGGHSLLAARLMLRIHRQWGVDLPPRHFFAQPTVAALASAVAGAQLTDTTQSDLPDGIHAVRVLRWGSGPAPLFLDSGRRWFHGGIALVSRLYSQFGRGSAGLCLVGPRGAGARRNLCQRRRNGGGCHGCGAPSPTQRPVSARWGVHRRQAGL